MALNRISKNMIDQDFVKQVNDTTEQLAQIAINVETFPLQIPEVDDTGRINRAIERAKEQNKPLFFPKGEYNHSGLILDVSSFSTDLARLVYSGTGTGVEIPTNSTNIEGLEFTSTGEDTLLVDITATGLVNFKHNSVRGGNSDGVRIKNAVNSINVHSNHIKNNKRHGVVSPDIKRSSVLDNFIEANGEYGIYFDGYSHGYLIGQNQIWGNFAGGIYIQGEKEGDTELKFTPAITPSLHGMIVGNHIDHNQDDFSTKESYGVYLDNVDRALVSNNVIRTSKTMGLFATGGSYGVTLVGNLFWKNADGTKSFEIDETCYRFSIIGNTTSDAEKPIIANPYDHTIIGTTNQNFLYGGIRQYGYDFVGGGIINQYTSGGGSGNMDIDMKSTTGRTMAFKNGGNDFIADFWAKTMRLRDSKNASRNITVSDFGKVLVDGSSKIFKNVSTGRPTLTNTAQDIGVMYLDTTLASAGKPIWWNGTNWVDATGTIV